MKEAPRFEVKVVSKEVVKPVIPTPSHLKNFTLSYVDQITTPSHTAGLLFYKATPTSQTHPHHIIARLKSSLSQNLTIFYPLAGRVRESTIICNDEGIPFIEALVDCPLSDVLNTPRLFEMLPKLLPPRDSIGNLDDQPNRELIHLSYQLNIFTCGGIVMSWYDIHKITDGTSAAIYLSQWAAIARGRNGGKDDDLLVEPNFDAAIKAFPPLPNVVDLLPLADATKDYVQDSATVFKSFVFSKAAIRDLKGRAISERVPNPSRLQAVGGFIWERALHVSKINSTKNDEDTILYLTIDMRPWLTPPLPKESIANLATMAVARAEKNRTMSELVAELHVGVSKMKDEIRGYKGEKAVEILRDNWNKRINALANYKDRAYKLVSWCNVGFNDLDFGFGKPIWVVPTDGIMSPIHKNLIVLNDYVDCDGGVGVEAWLFLEEKEMVILESDQVFLSFAKLYNPLRLIS